MYPSIDISLGAGENVATRGEGFVDLLTGDFQVRSLNVWVSQQALSVEAITVNNFESYSG
jgi:hypothetical protein